MATSENPGLDIQSMLEGMISRFTREIAEIDEKIEDLRKEKVSLEAHIQAHRRELQRQRSMPLLVNESPLEG